MSAPPTNQTKPMPKFTEAIEARKAKRLMPTTASSAQIAKLAPSITERATFLAKVNHLGTISKVDQQINAVIATDTNLLTRAFWNDNGTTFTNRSYSYCTNYYANSNGYDPKNPPKGFEPAKPGSLQDISSDARLNLVLDTNLLNASYGR